MRYGDPEQQEEKPELLTSLLRLVAAIAISYYIVASGGFAHAGWTAVVSAAAIVATMVSVVLGWIGVLGLPALAVRILMALTGGLLTVQIGTPGWVVFGVGAMNVLGVLSFELWTGALAVAVGGIPIIVGAALEDQGIESVVLTLCSVVGIGMVGYSRRLIRVRRRQDKALVERSRQLEQRSLEVIEQTERAKAETARAAALEERARISRDLHDVLAHSLGGLVVQLEAADAVLSAGGDTEQVASRLRTSRRLAVEGLQEARAAVRELRGDGDLAGDSASVESEQADVADAVRGAVRGPVGIHLGFDFDVVGEQHLVPATVAAVFAAVARESLTNINKHAGGGRSAGSLIFGDGGIRLEMINAVRTPVQPDHPTLADTGGGYGLEGMERRLADIGGTLSAGRDGDRWVVSAQWPVSPPEDDQADDDDHERDQRHPTDRPERSTRGTVEVS